MNAVAFSVDGKYLATGSWDQTARIIEVKSGTEIARINHEAEVTAVAFSADGKYLATGSWDQTARISEVKSGTEIARINHEAEVTVVAFNADGKYLATGSMDKTARISEVKSGTEIARINHEALVNAVAFSADGKYLATVSGNSAQLHLTYPRELMAIACSRLKRNLRVDEWQSYIKEPLLKYHLTCSDYPIHPSFLEKGKKLAREGKVEEAIALFKEAQQLDPDIDLDPSTQVKDQDPQAVAEKLQS